mmetsp:Transcript_52790/g.59747  ORF Transcript_52790/g.59747 Transcript_52790/m.59747 type:complete len:99 (-) Transcript_52790:159-455(-)
MVSPLQRSTQQIIWESGRWLEVPRKSYGINIKISRELSYHSIEVSKMLAKECEYQKSTTTTSQNPKNSYLKREIFNICSYAYIQTYRDHLLSTTTNDM